MRRRELAGIIAQMSQLAGSLNSLGDIAGGSADLRISRTELKRIGGLITDWANRLLPLMEGELTLPKEDNMNKYGVEVDEKEKTGADMQPATKCPECGSDLDDGGACPKHGTKPFERRPEPKKDP